MRRPATLGKMLLLGLLGLLVLAALPAQARTLRAQVDAVRTGVGSLQQVELVLSWPDGASAGTLEMRVAQLDMPLLSHRSRNLAWRCPLQRTDDGGWSCSGPLRASDAAPSQLSLAVLPTTTRAELAVGDRRLSYESSAASPDLSRIRLEAIPVAWLKAYLAGLWEEGQWTAGTLAGQIDVIAPAAGPFEVQAQLKLRDVGLETPDGWLAAAGAGGAGRRSLWFCRCSSPPSRPPRASSRRSLRSANRSCMRSWRCLRATAALARCSGVSTWPTSSIACITRLLTWSCWASIC